MVNSFPESQQRSRTLHRPRWSWRCLLPWRWCAPPRPEAFSRWTSRSAPCRQPDRLDRDRVTVVNWAHSAVEALRWLLLMHWSAAGLSGCPGLP